MSGLVNRHILLGVTGGIAAYKACELVRLLRRAGAEVRVVMTRGATEFVTPLTFQALSGQPVRSELFDAAAEAGMDHIELARWADLVLVAPASADFLARLAAGMADDLLATLCLAAAVPLVLAPAMNRQMWQAPATRENVDRLSARGVHVLGPATGEQACGEVGPGRMLEPAELLAGVEALCGGGPLAGVSALVTAGPTREAIDPVRFISNRSSGKMGFAVAAALAAAGADVVLVAGPVQLPTPPGVRRVDVESAAEMVAGGGGYDSFVEPGDVVTLAGRSEPESGVALPRLPQMPAYHLKRGNHSGLTIINIGVGPSNAKTITDHIAVLRPHAWLMLGHCAGLRNSQKLGDYALAHAYVRDDNVLDHAVPLWVPIPALSEIQIALEQAVSDVTGLDDYEKKKIMRTGTVATASSSMASDIIDSFLDHSEECGLHLNR